ncbi:chromate transporter [Phenylobacterium sp. J367]|nr:chromate transporter [Phenylobacterium sp. J367]
MLTFGGCLYTAILSLRNDAVGRGWMSDGLFLGRLGWRFSGVLPAPLITFSISRATWPEALGAVAMTVGIFLPAFAFPSCCTIGLKPCSRRRRCTLSWKGWLPASWGLSRPRRCNWRKRRPGAFLRSGRPRRSSPAPLAVLYLWKSKLNVVVIVLVAGLAGWISY